MVEKTNHLTLKWGTMKAWDFTGNEKAHKLLVEYGELGTTFGCMMQKDTPRQKDIICELIDLCDDPDGIFLDWDDKYVTKEEAKEYVRHYGEE